MGITETDLHRETTPADVALWTRTLDRIGANVAATDQAVLTVAAVLVVAVTSGFGYLPNLDRWMAAAFAPTTLDNAGTILTSPGSPALARLVGADSQAAYVLLHAVVLLGGLTGVATVAHRRYGPTTSRLVVVAWVALPISAVLSGWLGAPDPLIFAVGSGLVMSRRWWWVAAWGLVGGFTSFEQAAVIVICLAVLRGGWRHPAAGLAGVLAGRVGVELYNTTRGIEPGGDRLQWMLDRGAAYFVGNFVEAWQPIVFSLFAGGWLLVLWLGRRTSWRFPAALAVAFAVTLATADTTRVFSLLSWPIVLAAVLDHTDELQDYGRAVLGAVAVAALLVPSIIVWDGQVLAGLSWAWP